MANFLKIPQAIITGSTTGNVYINLDLVLDIRVSSTSTVVFRIGTGEAGNDVITFTFSFADTAAMKDFIDKVVAMKAPGKTPPLGQYELPTLVNNRTLTIAIA